VQFQRSITILRNIWVQNLSVDFVPHISLLDAASDSYLGLFNSISVDKATLHDSLSLTGRTVKVSPPK
jgi:hypothetical protein